jgi:hypothetical protein
MPKFFYRVTGVILVILLFNGYSFGQSITIQNILNQVNQDSLMHFVKELSGNIPTTINGQPYTIQSRHKLQPGNDKAMEYIQQKLNYYGLATTIQSFSTTGKNVYGVQTGTEFPNQKYIICAHFDDMPSGTIAPGADDNASGTAAVLEAARIFKNFSFPYTIVYALWDEEEQGLVGSAYYANQASIAGDSILGVINLDMIAWDSNSDGVANIHTRPVGTSIQLYNKMVEMNSTYGINLNLVVKNPGSTYSDHASFWSKNYGAILLIEDENDFHAYYHTVNDLIIHFNIPYFVKSAKLALATTASLALNENLSIQHTPITFVDNTSNILTEAAVVTGMTIGSGVAAPRLYYRTKTTGAFSQFYEVTGTPIESGTYNFIIPGQELGTTVQYYLAAQDNNSTLMATLPAGGTGFNPPGSTPPSTFYQFYVAQRSLAFLDNAGGTGNWTATGTWGIATNKYVSAPSSFTESPAGNYANNLNIHMTQNSPIVLQNCIAASLEFNAQWNIEADWDYAQVLISSNNGTTWTPLQGLYTNPGVGTFQPNGQPLYDGVQAAWVNEKIDISSYIGQSIKLRFLFASDGSQVYDGWYIDDVSIYTYSAVPVELYSLTAATEGNKVFINWSTSTETNNKGFEVQKSKDQKEWTVLRFVQGAGTSTAVNTYSYSEEIITGGTWYYRLKQIDYDGSYEIHGPIEVDLSQSISYSLSQNYPNPFNPETTIRYSLPSAGLVKLVVYNQIGEEVISLVNENKEAGNYQVTFNASGLASGVYFYRIISGEFSNMKKMIILK